jgi:hypothetical protein
MYPTQAKKRFGWPPFLRCLYIGFQPRTVVEFRFFGGLSVEETAEVLQVSPDTVARDWRLAKAWLLREMSGAADGA